MFAIIDTGGRQVRVAEGDTVQVDRLHADVGANIRFTEVLLLANGEEVQVGTPTVEGASVAAEVLAHDRDRKIVVFKMKRRKGYRVKTGHRQQFTEVRITGIEGG